MRAGRELDEELLQAIKEAIRSALSSRHVPHIICQVKNIPVSDRYMGCDEDCNDAESSILQMERNLK